MATKLGLSDLLEKKDLSKKTRRNFERDWYLNLAFIAGEQYVEYAYDPVNRIVELENPDNSIRALHNNCIKIARTESAKILKTRPVPIALPATDSQNDMYAARVVEAYFGYLREEWNFDRRLRDAVYWLVGTGNVFFKWYWNGANQVAVVSPFDVYPDPYAKSFLDNRWIIHSQFMDEETAKETYKGLKSADISAIQETSTDTLSPVESRLYSQYGDGTHNLPGVIINEYWERPSKSVPDGRFIVFTNHGVIYQSKFPYAHARLPFTHAGHIARTNNKWYASIMDYMRPLQIELNRTESQIIENRNMANGKWVIPAEVELSEKFSADPRQVVTFAGPPGLDPNMWLVTPQGMAAWVGQEPDRIKASMQDIAAQHEVSNAGVPGRVESGQAIQLLQETDDSVMTTTIHSLEEAIADGFLMSAFLFKQFGNEEVAVRVYDKDGMVEVRELKQDHVSLDMRVRIQTTTGLPQTIAGKWDRVMNLLNYQAITPQRAIEMLDLSVEDPELDPDMQDRKNQYRENKDMLAGKTVRAKKFDNHAVHVMEMNKFRKSEEYRQAIDADPFLEQRFDFHESEHNQLEMVVLQEEMQRQTAMQPPAPPGGGGGGGAPPPAEGGGPPMPQEPTPEGAPAPVA